MKQFHCLTAVVAVCLVTLSLLGQNEPVLPELTEKLHSVATHDSDILKVFPPEEKLNTVKQISSLLVDIRNKPQSYPQASKLVDEAFYALLKLGFKRELEEEALKFLQTKDLAISKVAMGTLAQHYPTENTATAILNVSAQAVKRLNGKPVMTKEAGADTSLLLLGLSSLFEMKNVMGDNAASILWESCKSNFSESTEGQAFLRYAIASLPVLEALTAKGVTKEPLSPDTPTVDLSIERDAHPAKNQSKQETKLPPPANVQTIEKGWVVWVFIILAALGITWRFMRKSK